MSCGDQKLCTDREQQSPVGRGNSPLLVHLQSVHSRLANSLLSSIDGANVCMAPISKANICWGGSKTDLYGSIRAKQLHGGAKNISTMITEGAGYKLTTKVGLIRHLLFAMDNQVRAQLNSSRWKEDFQTAFLWNHNNGEREHC